MNRTSFSSTKLLIPLYIIFIVAAFAWAFLYPALNWPDEAYKVSRIGLDDNLYLDFISRLSTNYCRVSYIKSNNLSYFSNSFHLTIVGDQSCYYKMKFITVVAILASAFAGIFFLRDKWRKLLYLMSLIWPANLFYMTGINQQTLFCTLSILIMVAVIGSKRIWPYILVSIGMVAIDRSFLSLAMYLSALFILRWKPKLASTFLIILAAGGAVLYYYGQSLSVFTGGDVTIGEISSRLEDYYDSPIISLGILFVSFVYLGGTNTILGIGVDYAIVLLFLLFCGWKARNNIEMRPYIYSFIFTYFFIIMVIPTIQSFRYYVFFTPVVIYFLVYSKERQSKYVAYSTIMSAVYLTQAAILS